MPVRDLYHDTVKSALIADGWIITHDPLVLKVGTRDMFVDCGAAMDTLATYRDIIERVLTEYAQLPYAYGDIDRVTVFDRERDHYLLLSVGWDNRRVHGCLVHIDIIDGKCWIQRDGTEEGIALDLEAAGIPKHNIVLAFHPPTVRGYSGYAAA